MTTYCYDRCGLAAHLGLATERHLSVLVLMKGCDLVAQERLAPFHNWLMAKVADRRGHHGHQLIEQVAGYIVSSRVPPSHGQLRACLDEIADDVFEGGASTEEKRLVRKVVDGYLLQSRPGAVVGEGGGLGVNRGVPGAGLPAAAFCGRLPPLRVLLRAS